MNRYVLIFICVFSVFFSRWLDTTLKEKKSVPKDNCVRYPYFYHFTGITCTLLSLALFIYGIYTHTQPVYLVIIGAFMVLCMYLIVASFFYRIEYDETSFTIRNDYGITRTFLYSDIKYIRREKDRDKLYVGDTKIPLYDHLAGKEKFVENIKQHRTDLVWESHHNISVVHSNTHSVDNDSADSDDEIYKLVINPKQTIREHLCLVFLALLTVAGVWVMIIMPALFSKPDFIMTDLVSWEADGGDLIACDENGNKYYIVDYKRTVNNFFGFTGTLRTDEKFEIGYVKHRTHIPAHNLITSLKNTNGNIYVSRTDIAVHLLASDFGFIAISHLALIALLIRFARMRFASRHPHRFTKAQLYKIFFSELQQRSSLYGRIKR